MGKLHEGKGVFDFVEAFYELYKHRKPVEAHIVGDGSAKEKLKRLIKKLKLEGKVHLMGYTPNVEAYYQKSHVCIIPSKTTEAFPRVAIEALACGCALVVSYIGGIKEAVEVGKNGYVFKAGNVDDLVKSTERAIQEWQKLSLHSLDLYRRKFSKEVVLNAFYSYLEELTR